VGTRVDFSLYANDQMKRVKPPRLNQISWDESPIWLRCLSIFVFGNFITFWIGVVYLGGDAVNGKIDQGHYFLASHGHFTEVSKAIYTYSKIHCLTAVAGIPLLMIVVVQYNLRKK
jgi:hypothetical protein